MAEVRLNIVAKDKASPALAKTSKRMDKLTGSSKAANRGMQSLTRDLGGMNQALGRVNPALGGLVSGMGSLGTALAGAAAVGLAAKTFRAWTNEIIDTGTALVDLSQKTGLSLAAVQELGFAGEQVGVSLKAVSDASLKLQRRLSEGLPKATGALRSMGLTAEGVLSLPIDEQFTTVAAAIGQVEDKAKQAELAFAVFGQSGFNVLPVIRSDVESTVEQFRNLGGVIDEEVLRAGKEFDDEMTNLSAAFQGLKAEIVGGAIPALTDTAKALTQIAEFRVELKAFFGELVAGFTDSSEAAESFADELGRYLLRNGSVRLQRHADPHELRAGCRRDDREADGAPPAPDIEPRDDHSRRCRWNRRAIRH